MAAQKTTENPAKTPTKPADGRTEKVAKAAGAFSFDQIQSAICEALSTMFPPKEEGGALCCGPYPRDVYDSVVVFSNEGQLFAIGYTFADGVATLSGQATPVRTAYVAMDDPTPPAPGVAAPGAAPPPEAKALDLGEVSKVAKARSWFGGALAAAQKKSPAVS